MTSTIFKSIKTIFLCFIFINTAILISQVSVGNGSYTTTFPGADIAGRNGFPSGTPQTSGVAATKPVPTNDWWSTLIKENHASNLFNYPLTMKTTNNGLIMTYIPWGVIGDLYSIEVGVTGLNTTKTTVSNFSDWTVTMNWNDGTNEVEATSGIGMPFVYFTKNSAQPTSIKVLAGTATISNEMLIITNAMNGSDYVAYAPTGSTWIKNGNTYTSTLNGKNYWSIVMLPQQISNITTVANEYKKYAYVFPTNTTADWVFDEATSKVTTSFNVITDIKEGTNTTILQGLLPHQWSNLANTSATPNGYNYQNVRGQIKTLDGNTFVVENTFKGILPTLPNLPHYSPSFQPDQLYTKITSIENDQLATWTDSYNEGQVMNRLIQSARIAHQTGNIAGRDKMIATIKERLEDWLTYESGEVAFLFYKHQDWDALLGYPAGHGQDNNINDHHFHWGYFIHAAAFLEQFEPGWESKWGPMINLLVRDAASPNRNDSEFPYLRNFSPYAGHSWANGFASFPQGNDQESTSESMQFASSLIHWGTITENTKIRDLGIYIYTTEQTAIEEYWFDMYDRVFEASHPYSLVSRVWGNSYDNGTFWTSDIEASYGIELYPIHGGSFYLSHNQQYAQKLWAEIETKTPVLNNTPHDNLWYDTYWKFLSMTNAQKAIDLYDSYTDRNLKFGVSDAQTYHWLHNMKALGPIDASITANYPIASVFNDNGTKTYVAHNYYNNQIVVEFSDGYQLTVPANQMKTSRDISVTAVLSTDKIQINKDENINLTTTVTGNGITKVEFYNNNTLLGEDVTAPYAYSTSNFDYGIYNLYTKVYTNDGFVVSNVVNVQVGSQKPYNSNIHTIPGIIEAAHYDEFEGGVGQNISYFDATINNEGDFRINEYVDAIKVTNEGATVGWISAGEWLEYTIDVQTTGCYELKTRYASGNDSGGGPIYFEIDGQKVTDNIVFTSTGDWNNWQTKTTNINLTAGTHILKLKADNGEVNIGRMEFIYSGSTCPVAQEMSLPFDFESFPVTSDFNNFDGGTAKVVDVVAPFNIGNSSTKMAKIVRDGGQPWSGSYINLTNPLDFSTNKYIMLNVWTDAQIGTSMQIKLERQNGAGFFEIATPTTTNGEWETLIWDFSQLGATTYDKLIFMFDIGNIGNGSNTSTFYFDDVQQTSTLSTNTFSINDTQIYPNPIKNRLIIKSNKNEIQKIEIYSLLGKKLKVINQNFKNISVEDLSSGLYLLKVYSENKSFTTRILKE
ncbi:MAG: carbohydrate-binding protein [Flavobacteriaceae bacterium]|nr:carbohydrate-binding protein [Flavobacteriaceae bacterium]